jgi:hypothetical protein
LPLADRRRGFRPSRDRASPGSSAPPLSRGQAFVRLDLWLSQILQTVP